MSSFNTQIIELFGLPKTGKTSTILELKGALQKEGRKVDIAKTNDLDSPITDKLHPAFNCWKAMSFMGEYFKANANKVDILIADRGLLDSLVWTNFLSKRSSESNYYPVLRNMIDQDFIIRNYLISFYFESTIDVILKREQESLEDGDRIKKGRIMNKSVLLEYSRSYDEVKHSLRDISEIIEIDTSTMRMENLIEQVVSSIYEINLFV